MASASEPLAQSRERKVLREVKFENDGARFTEHVVAVELRPGAPYDQFDWCVEVLGRHSFSLIRAVLEKRKRGRWPVTVGYQFGFDTLADATLFKLRWG
jgi:hypothetical protein